jgi:hypothetical protein
MIISEELRNQYFHPQLFNDFLHSHDRWNDTLFYHYSIYDCKIDFWANGIWTNLFGIISYWDYAQYLINRRSSYQHRIIQKKGENLYLVQGHLEKWYIVLKDVPSCSCPLFKLSKNRQKELPLFFQHLPSKYYCHHLAII